MILGRKLDNPYSVTNMKTAYEAIKEKYRGHAEVSIENISITRTHKYVQFKPRTEDELDSLEGI